MNALRPEIRSSFRIRSELISQTFELTTTDVSEVHASRPRCGALVQINRNSELLSHPGAELFRQLDAILHRGILERNERHDVGRADSRVLTFMLPEIDTLCRCAHSRKRSLYGVLGRYNERYHRSVVRNVGGGIEYRDAFRRRDCIANGADDFRATSLGKIRHAFYEFHRSILI